MVFRRLVLLRPVCDMACDNPLWLKVKGVDTPVPCGKCPPCKKRRVSEWCFRITWEEENKATSSHFITLTYDTTHVPLTSNGFLTLRKKDLQDFFKRLRKNTGIKGIKYYACGEYGTKTNRPHYHAIVFNCPDPEEYAKAWTLNGAQIGGVDIGTVTSDSVAYCLKYIDKDSYREKRYRHSRDDREKEFPLMSQGLGKGYIENSSVRAYHKRDLSKNYVTNRSGYRVAMPRYYRTKLFTEQELDAQRAIINVALEQNLKKEEYLFVPSDGITTLADRKEMQKQARQIKHAQSQKRRNKI